MSAIGPSTTPTLAVARQGLQALGDRHEQLVAHVVSQRVIDRLEAVEVEVAQACPDARRRAGEDGVEVGEECPPVGQSGQRVVLGLELELASQVAQRGDVVDQRQLIAGPAVLVAEQRHRQVGPDRFAIGLEEEFLQPKMLAFPADQLAVELPHLLHVGRVHELVHVTAAELLHRMAQEPHQGRIDLQDPAVQIADPDPYRGSLEDRAEAFFTDVQRRLRLLLGRRGRSENLLLLPQRPFLQRRAEALGDRRHERVPPAIGRVELAQHPPLVRRLGPAGGLA
jgi:hypothetical protein